MPIKQRRSTVDFQFSHKEYYEGAPITFFTSNLFLLSFEPPTLGSAAAGPSTSISADADIFLECYVRETNGMQKDVLGGGQERNENHEGRVTGWLGNQSLALTITIRSTTMADVHTPGVNIDETHGTTLSANFYVHFQSKKNGVKIHSFFLSV